MQTSIVSSSFNAYYVICLFLTDLLFAQPYLLNLSTGCNLVVFSDLSELAVFLLPVLFSRMNAYSSSVSM